MSVRQGQSHHQTCVFLHRTYESELWDGFFRTNTECEQWTTRLTPDEHRKPGVLPVENIQRSVPTLPPGPWAGHMQASMWMAGKWKVWAEHLGGGSPAGLRGVWSGSSPITQPPPGWQVPRGQMLCKASRGFRDPHSRLRIKALNCPSWREGSSPRIWSEEALDLIWKYLYLQKENVFVIISKRYVH